MRADSVPEQPADAQSQDAAQTGTSWTYTRIRYDAPSGPPAVPGVATGTRLVLPADGGTYALYYLFPMTEEQQTLSLVRRALLTAGCCCCCSSPASPGW